MIVFDVRFLIGAIRITVENGRFLRAGQVIFKSKYIGKLSAVIGKQNREKLRKRKPGIRERMLQRTDIVSSLGR